MKVAVIPARGGSKRIPRKNIKLFDGKPIIAYSIEAALQSKLFDEVIVSTDDEEIATVARELGATTPFLRPKNLADDYATTVDVIKHTINWYAQNKQPIDIICCIYATAPFLRQAHLLEGHSAVVERDFSFAFSATEYLFPIQRALKILDDGSVGMFYPEHMQTRSQDLEPAYHDAGQFYWGRSTAFLADAPIFSHNSYAVTLPSYLVQDIDTPADWIRAELMYKALEHSGC